MEKVIKTAYTLFYQNPNGVSYREQVIVTLSTLGFIAAIITPLIYLVALFANS